MVNASLAVKTFILFPHLLQMALLFRNNQPEEEEGAEISSRAEHVSVSVYDT